MQRILKSNEDIVRVLTRKPGFSSDEDFNKVLSHVIQITSKKEFPTVLPDFSCDNISFSLMWKDGILGIIKLFDTYMDRYIRVDVPAAAEHLQGPVYFTPEEFTFDLLTMVVDNIDKKVVSCYKRINCAPVSDSSTTNEDELEIKFTGLYLPEYVVKNEAVLVLNKMYSDYAKIQK